MIIKRITMLMVMIAAAAVLLVPKVSAYDDISLVEKCGTHYGYDYLANCTNPQGRQKLYNDMYKRACEVWQSDYDIKMRSDGYYAMGSYDLSKYGLTSDEAIEVLFTLKNDYPIFYFLSNTVAYSSERISVLVFEDTVDADVRFELQEDIYNYITKRASEMSRKKTVYEKVKLLHDKINSETEYEKNGNIPSDRDNAHSILGVINDGTGVCESYARTFEAVLNYTGIENVIVTGVANYDNHAWNMVKLDDGQYYFFDCTWDDLLSTNKFLGAGSNTMSRSHVESKPSQRGMEFLYALPKAAVYDYVPPKITYELGDVNKDGSIDIEDAVMLIGYINGTSLIEDTSLADVNKDKSLDIVDAVAIINYVNGISIF